MTMKFIINTLTHWDEPPRARHQVTRALSRENSVVYIAANKIAFPGIKKIRINDNLDVIQPYFPVDVRIRYRIPLLNEIYQIWLFRKIRRDFKDYIMINFDFSAYLIHLYWKSFYYYCNDNFTDISKNINNRIISSYHTFSEKVLAKSANLCVGTSTIIADNLRKINPKTYVIPLGGPNIDEYKVIPEPKRERSKKINVGLVGFISRGNMSYGIINDITSNVDCTVTLIGPVEDSFLSNLVNKERILLKGVLKDKELLDEVNKFDVAIAPYRENKINQGGMPNKLFIYLALGKPVVVTKLNSLVELGLPENLIYFVNSDGDFPQMIRKAHSENNNQMVKLRSDYAKLNTWDMRILQFLHYMKNGSMDEHSI